MVLQKRQLMKILVSMSMKICYPRQKPLDLRYKKNFFQMFNSFQGSFKNYSLKKGDYIFVKKGLLIIKNLKRGKNYLPPPER